MLFLIQKLLAVVLAMDVQKLSADLAQLSDGQRAAIGAAGVLTVPAGLPLLKEARVRQGYISTAPVVRIRESANADGCRCVLCFKGEGTLAREEVETDISAELFRRLTAFTGQDLVTKDYRVYALPGGERLEVSLVDAGRPTAFFYGEVEFPTVEAARAWRPEAVGLADYLNDDVVLAQ